MADIANSFEKLVAGGHPAFCAPTDRDARIWRYLDFAQFVWLLDRRRLAFPHCTRMEDPFEGSTPRAEIERLETRIAAAAPAEHRSIEDGIARLRTLAREFREGYFISSWHANDVESEAMWKLFAASQNAVALQSTFARLRDALPPYVGVGFVRYIDDNADMLPSLDPFEWIMHKRKSFAHERGVRAVASLDTPEALGGNQIRKSADKAAYYPEIDVAKLVEAVHVHPLGEEWFFDLVKRIVARFGFDLPVRRSELAVKPLF